MKCRFRLIKTSDFMRVRQLGRSYAHPLIVLIAFPNNQETSRFAVAAGRSVGKSVQRNRAKRLIREALRPFIPQVPPGWDILLLARGSITSATFHDCQQALKTLLNRALLINEPRDE